MKEKIYTIPVTDVFKEDCECPLCVLEKKLEDEYIEYFLGPSLMEPDSRIDTNEKGFCRRHIEQLYNKRENRLGLGLMIDTHLAEHNRRHKKLFEDRAESIKADAGVSTLKNLSQRISSKQTQTGKFIEDLLNELAKLENSCSICSKLEYTMDRYIDVMLYLWFEEEDFRKVFNSKKGFCLVHLKDVLIGVGKHLNPKQSAIFVRNLMELQNENMDRIQKEVNWFTKKFDYRNNDAPWGNSKDALIRSIQKIIGFANLR